MACGATWVARHSRPAGRLLGLLGVLVVAVRGRSLGPIVDSVCTILTFLIWLALLLNTPALRAIVPINVSVTAAAVLPLGGWTYEGIKEAYLCLPKGWLGLTHTSSS